MNEVPIVVSPFGDDVREQRGERLDVLAGYVSRLQLQLLNVFHVSLSRQGRESGLAFLQFSA